MTDIFFSYSSKDRERVRPVRDALAAQGFEVFWDQQVPAGVDWDTWIRQHLASCKCAIVFWSSASITSRNVRHEATIADQEGKLIPVLLEPLNAQQFPMGLYAQQAANLVDWTGDLNHEEWDKLRREYEAKLMPQWVRQRMDEKDAELVAERARRQGAERRDRTMQAQIAKEVELQQTLKREREDALDEVAAVKSTVEKLTQERAVELRKVRQSKAQETIRSIGAVLSPFVIAAALATLGFWTYQVMWSAPETLSPASQAATESLAAIKEEAQRQAKAAADAKAKLTTAEADQQRLKEEVERRTKAAGDVEAKLKVAETEQQRQASAAADADSKRRAAETEQQRLKEQLERQTKDAVAKPMQNASPSNRVGQFSLTTGIGVKEGAYSSIGGVSAIEVCSNTCAKDSRCKMFEYSHFYQSCDLFDKSLQSFVTYRNSSSSVGVDNSR